MNIKITNSTVYVNGEEPKSEQARNELLSLMYHARNKETMGGYDKWKEMLDWYYSGDWVSMCAHILSCTGKGGATRKRCLKDIAIIMQEEYSK